MKPGGYLQTMRLVDGKTLADVADLLRMLKLTGFNRPWPSGGLEGLLADIEADRQTLTRMQLLSLAPIYPFSLSEYRRVTSQGAANV